MAPKSWMVYFMETMIYKWMILGYPHFRKPPYMHVCMCTIFLYAAKNP